VTSVGLSAASACAAIRAGLTNHSETKFTDAAGEWVTGAQVQLELPWRGRRKLIEILLMAIEECLDSVAAAAVSCPLLLCVAEPERPGRLDGLDDRLFTELGQRLGVSFHPEYSAVVPYGRVGVAVALAHARKLIAQYGVERVLVAAADSLLVAPTLANLDRRHRLLTARNSNGFIPGEAAGAFIVASDAGGEAQVRLVGIGFGNERAVLEDDEPLKADGLTAAIKDAVRDAGCEVHDLDFRITDNSGEQYYFKESALALTRTLRVRKAEFDIWHPADCIGETGAAIGVVSMVVALVACHRAYAPGPRILVHCGNDVGQRAAVILHSVARS
jgi:3-oxoacyl-[acyl-carrier-protein] synthase I